MREIILHCFEWKITHITSSLKDIKSQGFNSIQISPIQPCSKSEYWWALYQPLGFTIGNRIGTKEDLIELCREAKKLDIKIIIDIVLRHVATDDGQLIPSKDVDKSLIDNLNFFTNAENIKDYENRVDIYSNAIGLPMLNYNNIELQDIYIKFLQELKGCSVSGFRIDASKHFALSSEGSNFWERVFGQFKDMFNYAECLDCSMEILDEYTKFINVLTNDNASDKSKMVIFIMSHDTELTFKSTLNMTDEIIISEWENLLKFYKTSHVLFYVRSFSNLWKSEAIRKINLENR